MAAHEPVHPLGLIARRARPRAAPRRRRRAPAGRARSSAAAHRTTPARPRRARRGWRSPRARARAATAGTPAAASRRAAAAARRCRSPARRRRASPTAARKPCGVGSIARPSTAHDPPGSLGSERAQQRRLARAGHAVDHARRSAAVAQRGQLGFAPDQCPAALGQQRPERPHAATTVWRRLDRVGRAARRDSACSDQHVGAGGLVDAVRAERAVVLAHDVGADPADLAGEGLVDGRERSRGRRRAPPRTATRACGERRSGSRRRRYGRRVRSRHRGSRTGSGGDPHRAHQTLRKRPCSGPRGRTYARCHDQRHQAPARSAIAGILAAAALGTAAPAHADKTVPL